MSFPVIPNIADMAIQYIYVNCGPKTQIAKSPTFHSSMIEEVSIGGNDRKILIILALESVLIENKDKKKFSQATY